jgi:signal transduction histidine kinase
MISSSELAELLEFFALDEHELDTLAELRPIFEDHSGSLVDAFYAHLLRFPSTSNLLENDGVRTRLLAAQQRYLMSLADPVIDRRYAADRVAIGSAHERTGLETKWYLGAYALYGSLLIPVICADEGATETEKERRVVALVRRLLLDAEIAIDQYIDRREDELNRVNAQLTQASEALSRKVDRTSADLRRTEDRARSAERLASVATLVTGLAHEIGTPMGVLRGHAEALENAVEGERARWRVQMITEQIDRLTSIMQSLLNLARPHDPMRVEVSLQEVISTAGLFLSDKFTRRGVDFSLALSGEGRIVGDPEKCQQVFLNLFLNAVDALGDRGGRLQVGLEEHDDDGAVEVTITDDGAGIPPEAVEHIFEPFFTTKEAGRGSGLGLMVVKDIVEEHGGELSVTTTEGEGTTFTLRFPGAPPA